MLLLSILLACAGGEGGDEAAPTPEAGAPSEVAPAAPPEAPSPSEAPAAAPALRVDLHVDTPSRLVDEGLAFDDPRLEAGLPRLREGQVDLVVEALWPQRSGDTSGRVHRLLERLRAEDARLDGIEVVGSPDEALRTVAAGRVALLIGIEGAHGLADDWRADLAELHGQGLRVLGLTWSVSNRFAGSSGDGGGGLTDEGRALLDAAWSRGMLVDLSHASEAATLDVCRLAPVPVMASHSNARAVCDVPRNLTDEEIRCIAATGGVVGLNLHAPFLCGSRDVAAAADHLEHLAAVGGHGVVSLSTDFDGNILVPDGLEHAGALPALLAELRARGWSEAQLRGLEGDNFLRAWGEAANVR